MMKRILSFTLASAGLFATAVNLPAPQPDIPNQPPTLQEMVSAVAKDYGIPFAFTDALIEVESGWNPSAINFNKGVANVKTADHGLMQINGRTAERLGVTDWTELHRDPQKNAVLGHEVISSCHDLAIRSLKKSPQEQKWLFTAACYNAGPSNWKAGLPHAHKVIAKMKQKLLESMS